VIRVGYIAGEPNPSRAPHLDRIAAHPDIELTVIYAAATVHRREWTLELKHEPVILRGPSLPLSRILHHDYPLTPQIWTLLSRERFDVLVIGGWSLLATQLAIVWARTHGVPYLLISENHFREPRPRWVQRVKAFVLPRIVPQANGHLVTGRLAREHQLHYGADPVSVTVFPNTVDVQAYGRRIDDLRSHAAEIRTRLGIPAEAVVITHVGRLIDIKAPDEVLEAASQAQARSDRPLHLVIAGNGPLRGSLERRAAELDMRVTFTGFRSSTELLEVYAVTDIFVLFSRREPWGIVVNEAAAAGLPLILTDRVGASADILEPGANGELVESGDIDAQADAIASLAGDEDRRARYGRRSRELIAIWGYEPSVESFVAAIHRATSSSTDSRRSA
jgi:glycosyltransferase involved in cell wall biosynthesis